MSTHSDGSARRAPRRPADDLTAAMHAPGPVQPASGGFERTVITAEIPATRTRAHARREARPAPVADRGELAPAPAPVGLRLIVWVLFFLFLIALIGLAVEHYHPDWLAFLRNRSASASLGVIAHLAR